MWHTPYVDRGGAGGGSLTHRHNLAERYVEKELVGARVQRFTHTDTHTH